MPEPARRLTGTSPLAFRLAVERDAPALAALHGAVAGHLTRAFGKGPWSASPPDHDVLRGIRHSKVIVAHDAAGLAGTLRLATRRPLAIDPTCFSPARRPLYLLDMAVVPSRQRAGVGRILIEEAVDIARAWQADAIRLDAYDAPAGAGEFYTRCGFAEAGRAVFRGTPLIYFERMVRAG